MKKIIAFLRNITPRWLLSLYHFCFAYIAAIRYGFPSRKMLVIGITGTKGKTSSSHYVWSVLQAHGIKTGMITTAAIHVGNEKRVNTMHMSMPGRFFLQKTLRDMVRAGCEAVVVETTSQGILQHRHRAIDYDITIFTNLSPEHIEAHGSYENYRKEKGKLFKTISRKKPKLWRGVSVTPVSILNKDDGEFDFYNAIPTPQKITYGVTSTDAHIHATHVLISPHSVSFSVDTTRFELHVAGVFMVPNALTAIAVARHLGLPDDKTAEGVQRLSLIPGRMEEIVSSAPFRVFLDYAHEQLSMRKLLEYGREIAGSGKVIVLFGAEGGGRDKSKRDQLARVVAECADFSIVTDTDPYEEDPQLIIEEIGQNLVRYGKEKKKDFELITDRRQAMTYAFRYAQKNDVIFCTGMGAQETMARKGGMVRWVDRDVIKEELRALRFL